MGLYAIPPEPPDLLLAYRTDQVEVPRATLRPPPPAPDIDLGQLGVIEVDTEETTAAASTARELGEQTGVTSDSVPMVERESNEAAEAISIELGAERLSSPDPVVPPSVNLEGLGDITLELENGPDVDEKAAEAVQTPSASAEVRQVYDLDLDEDLDGVPLGSVVDESTHGGDAEEIAEYMLEIEDDLDLEVDELELSSEDEAEEEDDDDR
jgi:hypothetical protein